MNIIKHTALLLCLIFISISAHAQMYKWVDKNGNVSYSDQPPFKGAEELKAPELSSVPAIKVNKKKPRPKIEIKTPDTPTKYTSVKIISPDNESTFQNNGGNIPLSISTTPALNTAQGHYLSVSTNGKKLPGKYNTSSIQLTNMDRGTHKISVSIRNKKGKTLRTSKPITIFLHRRSIIPR